MYQYDNDPRRLTDDHLTDIARIDRHGYQIVSLDGSGGLADSFGRLRVSEPQALFDAQFTYDLQPLLYEQIVAESGAAIAHDSTDRCATMTLSNTPTGGKAYMQSYEWIRYQPGKSQLIFITFNMIETKANTLKFAGYSDGNNGVEFQVNGTTLQWKLYSDSTKGDQTVAQSSWNIDTFDGTGPSGINLDITKVQIGVIDIQALYVGRVRVGFDIDGIVYYVHEFKHANAEADPYIQTANLPIRAGMTCTGTVSTTMQFICVSVMSEGGQQDVTGYTFSAEGTGTAGNGSAVHILSVQPNTTFNSLANRTKFVLESVDVVVTGANPVKWELAIGQAISGTTTFTDVNATYSAMEYNTAGTLDSTPAIVIAQGYVSATAQQKQAVSVLLSNRYPITLNAAGAVRVNGRLTLYATGIGGTSATRAIFNWREVR